MIDYFDGEYAFLSNFYYSPIKFAGITYPTVEHFFQAQKSLDIEEVKRIAAMPTPGAAKRAGRQIKLRSDWEDVKDFIMSIGLKLKFAKPELKAKLLATGDEELVEGNTWNDTYWGVCKGVGENHLGKLLMSIRENIKNDNKKLN